MNKFGNHTFTIVALLARVLPAVVLPLVWSLALLRWLVRAVAAAVRAVDERRENLGKWWEKKGMGKPHERTGRSVLFGGFWFSPVLIHFIVCFVVPLPFEKQ
jgi:hypothetical protein